MAGPSHAVQKISVLVGPEAPDWLFFNCMMVESAALLLDYDLLVVSFADASVYVGVRESIWNEVAYPTHAFWEVSAWRWMNADCSVGQQQGKASG